MSSDDALANRLLAGARGRRLVISWLLHGQQTAPQALVEAVWNASYQLESDRGDAASRMILVGEDETQHQTQSSIDAALKPVSLEQMAKLIGDVQLGEVREDQLITALVESVDWARYWQPADGVDTLFASPVLVEALRPIAEHVAAAGIIQRWMQNNKADDQWIITWQGEGSEGQWVPGRMGLSDSLAQWYDGYRAAEERSQERLHLPVEKVASGEWWSNPPKHLYGTTGRFFDGVPIGLACVEDSFGFEAAAATKIQARPSLPILEISDAEAWSELCRRYPLDVSAMMRGVWYETTGRDGKWVIPNWQDVARDYDGVHLPVDSYLALAGEVIDVDGQSASLIAGWTPGVTFWLTDAVEKMTDIENWRLTDVGTTYRWSRVEQSSVDGAS